MMEILIKKWARLDSNQRPNDYESFALTAELRAPNRLVDFSDSTNIERETGFEPANISLEG